LTRTGLASTLVVAYLCLYALPAFSQASAGQGGQSATPPESQSQATQNQASPNQPGQSQTTQSQAPPSQMPQNQTAQSPAGPNLVAPIQPAPIPPKEQADILNDMQQGNLMEIQAGQLAKQKGTTFQIREYGDRLVRDHKHANAMIRSYAKSHNVPLEATPVTSEPQQGQAQEAQTQEATAAMQKLQSQTGLEFDQSFLEFMENSHKTTIAKLGRIHEQLQGQPLGELIGQLLPILEQHFIIAATLDIRMRADGSIPQSSPQEVNNATESG
jgi:putative membrane protein